MNKYFKLATKIAMENSEGKHYCFGAVGIRSDGCIVTSHNIKSPIQDVNCHAEARLTRKLDVGSIVYVTRVNRSGTRMLNARPCTGCQFKMKNRGVKRCYYSINDNEFGVVTL